MVLVYLRFYIGVVWSTTLACFGVTSVAARIFFDGWWSPGPAIHLGHPRGRLATVARTLEASRVVGGAGLRACVPTKGVHRLFGSPVITTWHQQPAGGSKRSIRVDRGVERPGVVDFGYRGLQIFPLPIS